MEAELAFKVLNHLLVAFLSLFLSSYCLNEHADYRITIHPTNEDLVRAS